MKLRAIRIGIAAGVVGLLFIFCAPILPHARVPVICFGLAGCISHSGYQSLGRFLTGWGTVYFPPSSMSFYLGTDYATLVGPAEFFIIFLPALAALALLMAPELVRRRLPRAVFGAFGVFLLLMAVVFLVLLGGGDPRFLVPLATYYGVSGFLMVLGARRRDLLRI